MKRIFIVLAYIVSISNVSSFAQQVSLDVGPVINSRTGDGEIDDINQSLFSNMDESEIDCAADIAPVESSNSVVQNFSNATQAIVACIVNYIHSIMGQSSMEPVREDEVRALLCCRNAETNPRRERILAQVAKIVSGILNIARDPHNANNVGDSVGNMVHGIINVTIDAVQSKEDKKVLHAQLDEITKEMNEQVAIMMDMNI